MLKKIIFATLLSTSVWAQAENNISYNYLEIGYDYIDLDGDNANGPYLNASINIAESFYMGGYYDRDDLDGFDFDQYGIFLGFHKPMSDITDFYSEVNLGKIDIETLDSRTYGIDIGTRTAFTDKFELITKLGYTDVDEFADSYFKIGLKGLFKFNQKNSITVGVENYDGDDFGASIGFRHTF